MIVEWRGSIFPLKDEWISSILLTDWDLLPDLSHGSVSQSKIHTMATQQGRLLAHALSCEYTLKNCLRCILTVLYFFCADFGMEDYSLYTVLFSACQSQRFRLWSTAHAQCILRKMKSWWKECWRKHTLTPNCCLSGKHTPALFLSSQCLIKQSDFSLPVHKLKPQM